MAIDPKQVYSILPTDYKIMLVESFLQFLGELPKARGGPNARRAILDRLARILSWQRRTLERRPPGEVAAMIVPRIDRVIDPGFWPLMFSSFTSGLNWEILPRFKELIGAKKARNIDKSLKELDERKYGRRLDDAVAQLLKEYEPWQVAAFFCSNVLNFEDSLGWLEAHANRALGAALHAGESARDDHEEKSDSQSDGRVSQEFTVLDRVLIQQTIATEHDAEGCLDADDLNDLLETISGLNAQNHRVHFHFGFADALIQGRLWDADKPGLNDLRKQWYLTGVLAGLIRTRDLEAVKGLLSRYESDIKRAAEGSGPVGASLAKLCARFFVENGLYGEAALLISNNPESLDRDSAAAIVGALEDLVLSDREADAEPILNVLYSIIGEDFPAIAVHRDAVCRRLAQCLQARADFAGARAILIGEFGEGLETADPGVLADFALIESGVRKLWQLQVPESSDDRRIMAASLENGRVVLVRAVEEFGSDAVNAHFLLGLLAFLDVNNDSDEQEIRTAIEHLVVADAGIRRSPLRSKYLSLGVVATCRMMLVALKARLLDENELNAALNLWKEIPDSSVRFPLADVSDIIENAEAGSAHIAAEIASSVWRHRGADALDIVLRPKLLDASSLLRKVLATSVFDDDIAGQDIWRTVVTLIPVCVRAGERDTAERLFSWLEDNAEDRGLGSQFIDLVKDDKSLSELLTVRERAWILVNAFRKAGREDEAATQLRIIYFQLRDDGVEWEQNELKDFVEFARIDVDKVFGPEARAWFARADGSGSADESVLRKPVSVVFVGGNETQSQYDEQIVQELARNGSGITVSFRHTGWSSNWGALVDDVVDEANSADAVVMMRYMRTMLGRAVRAKLRKPWVACVGTGKGAMLKSIFHAAEVARR